VPLAFLVNDENEIAQNLGLWSNVALLLKSLRDHHHHYRHHGDVYTIGVTPPTTIPWGPNLHTKRSSIQSHIYQMSYWWN